MQRRSFDQSESHFFNLDRRPIEYRPTEFVLTNVTADSATFENPAHDYPKVIKYTRRADGALETAISGAPSQRTVTVVLKKQ